MPDLTDDIFGARMLKSFSAVVSGAFAFTAVDLWLKPFVRGVGWANWDENADASGVLFQHLAFGLLPGASWICAILVSTWGRERLLAYLAGWLAVPTATSAVLLVVGGELGRAAGAGFAPLMAAAVIAAVAHWALTKIFVIVRDA